MASYREIVTKAVIGKGKKHFTTKSTVTPEVMPSTILGCWVINHTFNGYRQNNNIVIEGSYDVNIWYSCLDDTKTEVVRHSDTYKEIVQAPNINDSVITDNEEIIIRSLNQPSCVKTEIENGKINYVIEKDLGIEIVGDTKFRIETSDDEDAWEEIEDAIDEEKLENTIDEEVKEEFLD
ncbi:MAG: outer spore coat protein CotE [bacterium]|nr:outer spore coat protein CotE [bacterium]